MAELSRRDLLTAAAAAATGAIATPVRAAESVPHWDASADVVVVGFGAAGASAAGPSDRYPKDLYIARHGQTEWNRLGRVQGDPDLNAKGYEDRVSLYLALREAGIEAVYSSALLRTRRTAALLADHGLQQAGGLEPEPLRFGQTRKPVGHDRNAHMIRVSQ